MSDVSAVVLTVGEPYTIRALDSLASQTVPIEDIVVVEGVSPFSRALNEGARRVRTPFFVQVDADMILDPTCVDVLRRHVRAESGIVVGALRDALAGQAIGVKLFRTESFRRVAMPDTISPDTDFGAALRRLGWQVDYVRSDVDGGAGWPTLGEHRPDYTASYTFRKMLLEGARLVHRPARHGLVSRMSDLERSGHPAALLAQVALAHGLFLPLTRDQLRPTADDPRAQWVTVFLQSDATADDLARDLVPIDRRDRLRDVFRRFLAAGQRLADTRAGATFRTVFTALSSSSRDWHQIVGRVAMAHGLLDEHADRARHQRDERLLQRFVLFDLGSRASARDRIRARAAHVVQRLSRNASGAGW